MPGLIFWNRPGRKVRPVSSWDMLDPREYWEERLRSRPGLDGVGYAGLGQAYNTWLYRVRERVFLDLVRDLRLDAPRVEVLDVGSGTGFYVRLWRRLRARRVVGSDLTDVAVGRLAAAFPGSEFIRMDVGDELLPLGADRFDVVSAFDVLFHIVC